MADEKELKRKRLEISLNLENKEDKEVWNILRKKKNINAYFRQAVLYQAKGQRLDWQTAEDIRETIESTIREVLSSALIREDFFEELKAEKKPVQEKTFANDEEAADDLLESDQEQDEDEIDLTGFEDFMN